MIRTGYLSGQDNWEGKTLRRILPNDVIEKMRKTKKQIKVN
jgi:hypothetical protein